MCRSIDKHHCVLKMCWCTCMCERGLPWHLQVTQVRQIFVFLCRLTVSTKLKHTRLLKLKILSWCLLAVYSINQHGGHNEADVFQWAWPSWDDPPSTCKCWSKVWRCKSWRRDMAATQTKYVPSSMNHHCFTCYNSGGAESRGGLGNWCLKLLQAVPNDVLTMAVCRARFWMRLAFAILRLLTHS